MSRWRPTPEEERWLEAAARLRGTIPRDAVDRHAGGWRSTGPFPRIALFVLGVLAAALASAVLGFGDEESLLVAGLLAAAASEWLKVSKRFHASGIEEGLCTAAYLMIGVWVAEKIGPASADRFFIAVIAATAAASLRLLNANLMTCAALVAVGWFGSTQFAHTIGGAAGGGTITFVLALVAAAAALLAGRRTIRRPSYDRMLDGVVIALPLFAYQWQSNLGAIDAASGLHTETPFRLIAVPLLLAFAAAALVAGLRRRRHAPIIAFLGCMTCLAAEWARASQLPAEYWLIAYGAVAIAVAAAVERHLRRPRNGFTSAKLTDREGPLELLQSVGAAVLTQRTSPPVAPDGTGEQPHEGQFGGGGATGRF